jgi:hypothetical protein
MNENSELDAHRVRSISAIIRDGYLLYSNNFKRMFRASWLIAIVYALAFAWMMSYLVNDIIPLSVAIQSNMTDPTSLGIQYLLFLGIMQIFEIVAIIFASCGFKACYEHYTTGEIVRTKHWWGTFPMKTFFKLIIPAICWFFRNWRHWGFLIGMMILVDILIYVITIFCGLPGSIMMLANIKAYTGAMMGDPLGMPDYLSTMSFVAFTIAGFIQAYVHLWSVFPFYYTITTVKQKEINKKKYL